MLNRSTVTILAGVSAIAAGVVIAYLATKALHPEPTHVGEPAVVVVSDDSDLQMRAVHVADEQNAYFALQVAGESALQLQKDPAFARNSGEWRTADEVSLGRIVSTASSTLRLIKTAETKPAYQVPEFAGPTSTNWENVKRETPELTIPARIAACEVVALAKAGRGRDAMDAAIGLVRLGRLVSASQADLLSWLNGLTVQQIGLEAMQAVIASSDLDAKTLSVYEKGLNAFSTTPDMEGLTAAYRVDYSRMVSNLKRLVAPASDWPRSIAEQLDVSQEDVRRQYDVEATTRLFADYERKRIEQAATACESLPPSLPVQRVLGAGMTKHQFLAIENASGKLEYDTQAGGKDLALEAQRLCMVQTLTAATRAIIALHAMKAATGRLPSTLSELVPQYLPAVPDDPYDGRPLRYDPTKGVTYSVGKDRLDIGGSAGEDWRAMPNPTFRLAF
jgi:hypothetical protein